MSTIKLGGDKYEVSTLNLNVMERLQDKWDCPMSKLTDTISERLDERGATALKFMVWAFLTDQYPELTEQEIGAMIDVHKAQEYTDAILAAFKG